MKFITRSLLLLLLLYGVVFAVGDAYLIHAGAPIWIEIAFPIVWIGLQYLLSPKIIELVLDIVWDQEDLLLPAPNREFIQKLCRDRGLKVPRIGIIQSGTPNAFSFGRLRSDARVVVTSGLLEILTPEEINAVLAHEIGHIEHYDFAVMTLAALAPMLLYQLYVISERINNFRALAYTAYLSYLLSQFIVLMLNRTREYFADHYAAEVTRMPDELSSALVKIAYGMVRADGEYRKAIASKDDSEKSFWRRERRLGGTIAVMGIAHLNAGRSLVLGASPEQAAAVMRWDLVNPWARFYELNSTHPLTALRVRELNRFGSATNPHPRYELPQDQRIRWGLFPLEFLLWSVPLICIGAFLSVWWFPHAFDYLGITLPDHAQAWLLIAGGFSWILKIAYRYRGAYQETKVGALLEDMDVSQMRPRAVRLRGTVVGRGEPGAFWSPHLVLRDDSGIMFLLYRQSIPLAAFLFGITEAENYAGQEVVVEGWFRRGVSPYVEMAKIADGYGNLHRTYSRWVQFGLSLAAIAIGLIWMQSF